MILKSFSNLVIVLVLLNLYLKNYGVEGGISKEEDMELDKKLKILNKPPVKSIKTTLGNTYDCINIYKQPAFDHPLLRNHKIQMKPNVIQGKEIDGPTSSMVSSVIRFKIDGCPSGTVPIRRTTKEDLVNAKRVSNQIVHRHYVSAQPVAEKLYYGGRASISVATPIVGPNQLSTGQIWIQNGPAEELNSIEFGWAVYPNLFGDNATHVFGLWTADGFKETGCYNMLCPGFIQIHPTYTFGEHLIGGTYGGEQFTFDFSVHRDPKSGNWWFINGVENTNIGYWPKELFTHLENDASVISYGGIAGGDIGDSFPPMGHEHLPISDPKYTTCITDMKVSEKHGIFLDFDTSKVQLTRNAKASCYDLIFYGKDTMYGIMMFFGGPGGNCT
ncbi:hypothetical protein C5167_013457 [Papaver somniferum]|uniref:Neprosin PEP catalytic domain-containing protein n=2 Tax=Papaver somniferum TaxID=3469 RepID=A0A4Y7J4E4_PAPSO|nr:hypothetical protein C5167_013457 [Papaver somniferum]